MSIVVIPAQAGLRRQDAEANIGCTAAGGPKGELQEQVRNPSSSTRWTPAYAGATTEQVDGSNI